MEDEVTRLNREIAQGVEELKVTVSAYNRAMSDAHDAYMAELDSMIAELARIRQEWADNANNG